MAMSMTGYGSSVLYIEDASITVEIRTVNHRFLDIAIKMPSFLLFLEEKIKKIIQYQFKRGRIEVIIEIAGSSLAQKKVEMDWELLDEYMEKINAAKERYSLSGELPVTILTSLPNILTVQEGNQKDAFKDAILASVEKACEQAVAMRRKEGEYLFQDLMKRVSTIEDIVILLQTRRTLVIEEYRKRIKERVEDQLEGHTLIDPARIHQEIVLLAEKGDITEEVTRLISHIEHFRASIQMNDAIGRKLDFITQEMHREVNTIGSKSTDAKLSEWTISLKGEIEKIKEQVQNIE
ncbi:YicC family protein [Oceanobacillus chungangensis]|uniref:YicC family protein n=2 Tax=Oceanobacillus chungangensis TaxID=1229152 RepID=A0A3D8PP61_9BACI|nr:YicC family protein [Oceanobacillus chungangensis]